MCALVICNSHTSRLQRYAVRQWEAVLSFVFRVLGISLPGVFTPQTPGRARCDLLRNTCFKCRRCGIFCFQILVEEQLDGKNKAIRPSPTSRRAPKIIMRSAKPALLRSSALLLLTPAARAFSVASIPGVEAYTHLLTAHPLETKVSTAAALASLFT